MKQLKPYPGLLQALLLLLLYFLTTAAINIPFVLAGILIDLPVQHPYIQALVEVISFVLLLLWVSRYTKIPAKELLTVDRLHYLLVLPVILLILGSNIIESEIDNIFRTFVPMSNVFVEYFNQLFDGSYGIMALITLTVIVAPLVEEIIFRGIMLKGFLQRYSVRKAILMSALIFGIAHMNPWQFISAFIWGIIAGWLYYRTRSLAPCILGHAFNNFMPFLAGIFLKVNIPGYTTSGYNVIEHQPMWFNLIGLILLASGFYLAMKIMKMHKHAIGTR